MCRKSGTGCGVENPPTRALLKGSPYNRGFMSVGKSVKTMTWLCTSPFYDRGKGWATFKFRNMRELLTGRLRVKICYFYGRLGRVLYEFSSRVYYVVCWTCESFNYGPMGLFVYVLSVGVLSWVSVLCFMGRRCDVNVMGFTKCSGVLRVECGMISQ